MYIPYSSVLKLANHPDVLMLLYKLQVPMATPSKYYSKRTYCWDSSRSVRGAHQDPLILYKSTAKMRHLALVHTQLDLLISHTVYNSGATSGCFLCSADFSKFYADEVGGKKS